LFAELFVHGEIVDGAEAEGFEEEAGRFVEVGTTECVVGTADFDETAIHELLEHFDTGDAADGFDVSADDRLAVGDDGEGFHLAGGEFEFGLTVVEFVEPVRVLGAGEHLIPGGDLFDAEGSAATVVDVIEFPDDGAGFGGIGQGRELGEFAGGECAAGDEEDCFDAGHFGRSKILIEDVSGLEVLGLRGGSVSLEAPVEADSATTCRRMQGWGGEEGARLIHVRNVPH